MKTGTFVHLTWRCNNFWLEIWTDAGAGNLAGIWSRKSGRNLSWESGQDLELEIWTDSGAGNLVGIWSWKSGRNLELGIWPESGIYPDKFWVRAGPGPKDPSRLRTGGHPGRRIVSVSPRVEGNPTRAMVPGARLPTQFPTPRCNRSIAELSWQSPVAAGSEWSLKIETAGPLSLRGTICHFSREMQTVF